MVRIGESISFDKELYKEDIKGSISHAKMLHRIGILNETEVKKIESGLLSIQKE
ncbi:MAG: argininosuccinate lyase, partial [Leptospira sp.]|nr:argininosuccinate lyase [Leptospira sp.]